MEEKMYKAVLIVSMLLVWLMPFISGQGINIPAGKNTATGTVDVPKGKELIGYKVHDLVNMASVEVTGYDENGEKVAGFTFDKENAGKVPDMYKSRIRSLKIKATSADRKKPASGRVTFTFATAEKTTKVKVPDGKVLLAYKVRDLVNMASVEITGYDKDGNKVGGHEFTGPNGGNVPDSMKFRIKSLEIKSTPADNMKDASAKVIFTYATAEKTTEVKVPDGKVLVGYKVHDLVNMAVETTGYDKDGKKVGGKKFTEENEGEVPDSMRSRIRSIKIKWTTANIMEDASAKVTFTYGNSSSTVGGTNETETFSISTGNTNETNAVTIPSETKTVNLSIKGDPHVNMQLLNRDDRVCFTIGSGSGAGNIMELLTIPKLGLVVNIKLGDSPDKQLYIMEAALVLKKCSLEITRQNVKLNGNNNLGWKDGQHVWSCKQHDVNIDIEKGKAMISFEDGITLTVQSFPNRLEIYLQETDPDVYSRLGGIVGGILQALTDPVEESKDGVRKLVFKVGDEKIKLDENRKNECWILRNPLKAIFGEDAAGFGRNSLLSTKP